MSKKVTQWRESVNALASDQELINSIDGGEQEKERIEAWIETQGHTIDDRLKLRVLRPNLMNVDMVNKPPFGFAGLELVRQAQASKKTQKPEVHMLGSDSAHIALAAPVIKNETVVAVIVTSVDVGALQKAFKATVASEKGGWLSLKQGGLVVVTGGDKAQHKGAVLNGGVVGGTAWKITINKESVELPISKEDLLTYVIALTLVVIVFGGLAILFSDQERREKINEFLKKRSKAKEDKKAQAAAKAEER